MADFTDVANTLVGVIAGVIYPNGTSAASIAPSAAPIQVYQGWPIAEQLDVDLKASKMHVSVWPTPTERLVEQRMPEWQQAALAAPTITLIPSGNTVTAGGTGGAGQNAALVVDGKPYVYAVQANDTPQSIATALAALIAVDRTASSAGAVLTIPGTHSIVARVGTTGTSMRELRRQEKVFQISVWADRFDKRDPVASAVDAALAGIYRLTFPDGSQGILRYRSSNQVDNIQKNGIYRRDMLYAVEYATTESRTDTQIVTEQTAISAVPLPNGTAVGQIIINQ